jgi:hypothetical protein
MTFLYSMNEWMNGLILSTTMHSSHPTSPSWPASTSSIPTLTTKQLTNKQLTIQLTIPFLFSSYLLLIFSKHLYHHSSASHSNQYTSTLSHHPQHSSTNFTILHIHYYPTGRNVVIAKRCNHNKCNQASVVCWYECKSTTWHSSHV